MTCQCCGGGYWMEAVSPALWTLRVRACEITKIDVSWWFIWAFHLGLFSICMFLHQYLSDSYFYHRYMRKGWRVHHCSLWHADEDSVFIVLHNASYNMCFIINATLLKMQPWCFLLSRNVMIFKRQRLVAKISHYVSKRWNLYEISIFLEQNLVNEMLEPIFFIY